MIYSFFLLYLQCLRFWFPSHGFCWWSFHLFTFLNFLSPEFFVYVFFMASIFFFRSWTILFISLNCNSSPLVFYKGCIYFLLFPPNCLLGFSGLLWGIYSFPSIVCLCLPGFIFLCASAVLGYLGPALVEWLGSDGDCSWVLTLVSRLLCLGWSWVQVLISVYIEWVLCSLVVISSLNFQVVLPACCLFYLPAYLVCSQGVLSGVEGLGEAVMGVFST